VSPAGGWEGLEEGGEPLGGREEGGTLEDRPLVDPVGPRASVKRRKEGGPGGREGPLLWPRVDGRASLPPESRTKNNGTNGARN